MTIFARIIKKRFQNATCPTFCLWNIKIRTVIRTIVSRRSIWASTSRPSHIIIQPKHKWHRKLPQFWEATRWHQFSSSRRWTRVASRNQIFQLLPCLCLCRPQMDHQSRLSAHRRVHFKAPSTHHSRPSTWRWRMWLIRSCTRTTSSSKLTTSRSVTCASEC